MTSSYYSISGHFPPTLHNQTSCVCSVGNGPVTTVDHQGFVLRTRSSSCLPDCLSPVLCHAPVLRAWWVSSGPSGRSPGMWWTPSRLSEWWPPQVGVPPSGSVPGQVTPKAGAALPQANSYPWHDSAEVGSHQNSPSACINPNRVLCPSLLTPAPVGPGQSRNNQLLCSGRLPRFRAAPVSNAHMAAKSHRPLRSWRGLLSGFPVFQFSPGIPDRSRQGNSIQRKRTGNPLNRRG